jgi:hypothetical protein
VFSEPDKQSSAMDQIMESPNRRRSPPNKSCAKPKQSSALATSFIKRRHEEAFAEESSDEEQISPSKKPRASTPEILPRIHRLQSPRNGARRKRGPVSDRDRNRRKAGERALFQSFRQLGLLQASTISRTEMTKNRPLMMALGPSSYDHPSEYLLALPVAQTPNLWDVSEFEESESKYPLQYVIFEDGQYRFDLEMVAYELTDDVLAEEAAHIKWVGEVIRSVHADMEEYVDVNPEYHSFSALDRGTKLWELSCQMDDAFTEQWYQTCRDIPFDAIDEDTTEAQVVMSIALAAHLSPLPIDLPEDEIEEFVESVQRRGLEYHRAHNRKFYYLWKEKAKIMREQEQERKEKWEREWQAGLWPQLKEEQEEEEARARESTLETGGSPTTPSDDGELPFGNSPPEPVCQIDPLLLPAGSGLVGEGAGAGEGGLGSLPRFDGSLF